MSAFVTVAALVWAAACGPPDDGGVTIALPSSTLLAATTYIAADLGLFAREGLDVEIQHVAGVAAVNAVIAGSAEFTVGSGGTMMRATGRGQRLTAIANVVDRPLVELVLRRDVADRFQVRDGMTLGERGRTLKGLTIAVQGVGSIIHAWVRYLAAAAALDADRDVRITPMDPSAMVAALDAGLIDGYATSPPFTTQSVLAGGATMLASGVTNAEELRPFGYALIYGKPETCEARRRVCEALVRAFAAALRMVHERPDEVLRDVLRKRFPAMNDELLTMAWARTRAAHAQTVVVNDSHFANSQALTVKAGMLPEGEAVRDFAALYTNRFSR